MPEEQETSGNCFAVLLGNISHGDLSDQASEKLAELVKAVHDTRKSGKLTLKIEIKPRGADSGQVEINGKVDVTMPIPDVAPSMMFADEDGHLHKDNPRQGQLPFGDQPKKASNQ